MVQKKIALLVLFLLIVCGVKSQELIAYKQVDSTTLFLEVHRPEKMDTANAYPAMVFFFGGGWNSGSRNQCIYHAEYFSKRGVVCFLADYRTYNKYKTSPFKALIDAKSAIRFIKQHAAELSVDTTKIIASGGSAGGHLAAATALITSYNDPKDDLSVSCKPNALVLFNPVIDNGPGGYGFERIGMAYKDFSPLHNIQKGAPPTILFLGTADHLIPVTTVEYYKVVMNKVKSRCELKIYEGGKHGFFNYNATNLSNFRNTVLEADTFLQSLGYLTPNPSVLIE